MVAPFVGAWIEIVDAECKQRIQRVAPFVGAWIEIRGSCSQEKEAQVAPFVGAWIEIAVSVLHYERVPSLPSWERGLKSSTLPQLNPRLCRSLRGSVD